MMNLTKEMLRGEDIDMSYFSRRRTIRNFHPEPLDDELLTTIVRQATKAPTTGNMQLYSVICTRMPERKQKLAELHFCQPATNAPVLLTICADFHRFERWCRLSGTTSRFNNLQGFLYGLFDAAILTQQITTIAELHGLGTCILGTTAFNAPEIAELLKLPKGVVPLLTLAIGVPDGEGEATERLPVNGVLHFEEYKDPSDAEVAEIYAVKDNFAPNKEYVTENGKPSLAHVFTEVRYPEEMNVTFSKKLDDWLKAQDINL